MITHCFLETSLARTYWRRCVPHCKGTATARLSNSHDCGQNQRAGGKSTFLIIRLCRITSGCWSVVLRQDRPPPPPMLERRLSVSLFNVSVLPTTDLCHAAEDARLAVHGQSFLNLPRQNGRLVTKVFIVFYCIALSLSLVKIKMKTFLTAPFLLPACKLFVHLLFKCQLKL